MAYTVSVYDKGGCPLGELGPYATIIEARNAMIKHAGREFAGTHSPRKNSRRRRDGSDKDAINTGA
jgi:hypothetical protein